jgi:glycosyltransferase involved in cell wall biosynthesis
MRNIVVSAIKFGNAENGALAILQDCLSYLSRELSGKYNLISLVNRKALINVPNVTYYEFPDSGNPWHRRYYYEYVYFRKFSKEIKPYLWLSLHDVTPNVEADISAVYCHNAAAFYKVSLKTVLLERGLVLFSLFYKHLYRINIKKNDYIIVQQEWMRERFVKAFGVRNIIVAHPEINLSPVPAGPGKNGGKYKFFYPSFPRLFKNFEVICEAAKNLNGRGIDNFEVLLTIDGSETRYSRYVYNKYKGCPGVKFIGVQPRKRIPELYDEADCVIFSSKLESWGIPITEFKKFGKPILLADLEYAHETIGDYDKVRFFDPDNPDQLSGLMNDFMLNRLSFEKVNSKYIEPPYAANWKELFDMLLNEKR